jgi:hypothetical protein
MCQWAATVTKAVIQGTPCEASCKLRKLGILFPSLGIEILLLFLILTLNIQCFGIIQNAKV